MKKFSLLGLVAIVILFIAIFPIATVGISAINSISEERQKYSEAILDRQSNLVTDYQEKVDELLQRLAANTELVDILAKEKLAPGSLTETGKVKILYSIAINDNLEGPHSFDILTPEQVVIATQNINGYDAEFVRSWQTYLVENEAASIFLGLTNIVPQNNNHPMVTTIQPVFMAGHDSSTRELIGWVAVQYTFNEALGGVMPLAEPAKAYTDGPLPTVLPESASGANPKIPFFGLAQKPIREGNEISILVDENRQVVSDVDGFLQSKERITDVFPETTDRNGSFRRKIDGEFYLVQFTRLDNPDLILIHLSQASVISSVILPYQNQTVISILISMLIILVVGFAVAWVIIGPVLKINKSLRQMQSNTFDWNTRIPSSWLREIDELVSLFNSFLDNQKLQRDTELALITSEQKYRDLFERSPLPLMEADLSGILQEVNRLGYDEGKLEYYLNTDKTRLVDILRKQILLNANQAAIRLFEARDLQHLIENWQFLFTDVSLDWATEIVIQIKKQSPIFETTIEVQNLKLKKIILQMRWSVISGSESTMDRVIIGIHDITDHERAIRMQDVLLKISEYADTSEDLHELYTSIHGALAELMPVNNFYIANFDETTGMLSFPYFVDEKDHPPPDRQLGNGWTEIVIRSGKPVLINENMVAALRAEELNAPGSEPVCWLGVPLIVKDKTIGVVTVQSYDEHITYTTQDRDVLTIVANQIALAISEMRAQAKLVFAGTHDELTGLYNRAYYENEVKRLSAGRDEPVGVIMIDIDGLKYVNDNFGHGKGDLLIKESAEIIKNAFRENDVVARIGGDEFAILLPKTDSDEVVEVIQRIEYKVEHYSNPDLPVKLDFSMGGHSTDTGSSLRVAIMKADQAMYRMKTMKKESPHYLGR